MPVYKKNSEKNEMRKLELPSTPGAFVYVPDRLGYGSRIRVRSSSYKVHVEQLENGEDRIFQTIDPAAAERELLKETLCDARTYHNLQDEHERPIRIDPAWIETEMDEEDALFLGQQLMAGMPDELGLPDNSGDAEDEGGNETGEGTWDIFTGEYIPPERRPKRTKRQKELDEREATLRQYCRGGQISLDDQMVIDILTCHELRCLPRNGGLYDQDAEFVEWYFKFRQYLAEAGHKPPESAEDGQLDELDLTKNTF